MINEEKSSDSLYDEMICIGPIPLNLKDYKSIIIISLTLVITKPKFMTIYLAKYEHALSNTTLEMIALLMSLFTNMESEFPKSSVPCHRVS